VDAALAVPRLVLAVVFAVAGLKGLADLVAGRRTVRAWGVPAGLVNVCVAVGLMYAATAWWSALVALGCLLVPVVPVAGAMARPGGSVAGLSSVVRATALTIPAAVVIWRGYGDPGPDLLSWWSGLLVGQQIAVLGGVAVLAFVASGVRPGTARRSGKPLVTPESAPIPRTAATLIRRAPELTIGMATYDDFDGVYFTLQALRLYHDLENTELLVVDNYGCGYTRDLVHAWVGGTYVRADDIVGTAAPRDLVFRKASGAAVLCCDSHVLFAPGAIARLKRFYRDNPACADLLQGPLLYDDGELISTHLEPVWREQMWGTWASDPRGHDPDGEPFEISMQGLGVFSCRSEAWLGFHPGFRGFGGEEGYIHEKFRQAGQRCLCLPWLRWMHRFGRPRGAPYPLTVEDKLRNYLLGHTELGLDPAPVLAHFSQYLPADRVTQLLAQVVASC
jgi:hypothetical protein